MQRSNWSLIGFLLSVSLWDAESLGVTQYTRDAIGFVRSPSELRSSLNLLVADSEVKLHVPPKQLLIRAKRSSSDERIEPVSLSVSKNANQLSQLAIQLAIPEKSTELHKVLVAKVQAAAKNSPGIEKVKIDLEPDVLKLIEMRNLAELFQQVHHAVSIQVDQMMLDKKLRDELTEQLNDFLTESQQNRVAAKISKGIDLLLEDDLLPSFAKKMVRRFVLYRGPNCFHAALAFHGSTITKSPWVNVTEEKGYHRAMINYDELWRVLKGKFYEVDPAQHPLKFGDLLVFFDAPAESKGAQFRWIRHTATYLLGQYTFSKGSKSPNTPYTVKNLQKEWSTWRKFTKNLGVKVFRRAKKSVTEQMPTDRTDWIY